MDIPNIKLLPKKLCKFSKDYLKWRKGQNQFNNDTGDKRFLDCLIGKFGEYKLWERWPALLEEPDYSKYTVPKFGADLLALKNDCLLHVKMCSWIEMDYSAGWLVAKSDPITKMEEAHEGNILVFGYVTKPWKISWAGWCFVNEMFDHDNNICYYNLTRSTYFRERKFGIWPKNTTLLEGRIPGTMKPQTIKIHGVIENEVLYPIDELESILKEVPCQT